LKLALLKIIFPVILSHEILLVNGSGKSELGDRMQLPVVPSQSLSVSGSESKQQIDGDSDGDTDTENNVTGCRQSP
jgi:hypothetical protein